MERQRATLRDLLEKITSSRRNVIIVMIVAIVLLGAIVTLLFGKAKEGEREVGGRPTATHLPNVAFPPDATVKPIVVPEVSEWATYEKAECYKFKYPEVEETEVREIETGQVVSLLGSMQREGSEVYDGVNVAFVVQDLGGMSLRDKVAEKVQNYRSVGAEIRKGPEVVRLGGREGYFMELLAIGEMREYYFELDGGRYLKIEDTTSDPNGLGYSEIVEEMLETVEFGNF